MTRIISESYELGTQTLRCRTSGGSITSTAGLSMNGTWCLTLGNSGIKYTNTGSDTDIYIAFFFRLRTPAAIGDSNTNSRVLSLYSVAAAELGSLRYNGITGHLALYTGTATSVATGTASLSTGSTYHIQIRHKVSDTVGVFELRVNATLDATFTGDTKPGADTYTDYIDIFSSTFGHSFDIDDVLINNSLGSSPDNTYPGINRIAAALVPTGVGFYVNNWSRNTGATNWQAVDEVPNDGDTTYVFTSSANIYESFSMSDQNLSNVNYKALMTSVIAKKDSGTVQLALGIRDVNNSIDYYGANSALGVSYGVITERRTTDPATGTAWTSARLNSVESLIVSTTG